VATIGKIRGVSQRTIQRHLKELVSAHLLTRQERPGETTILIIEDVSEEETQSYLRQYLEEGDKNVTPPPTTLSPKIKERKENEINVKEIGKISEDGRGDVQVSRDRAILKGNQLQVKQQS